MPSDLKVRAFARRGGLRCLPPPFPFLCYQRNVRLDYGGHGQFDFDARRSFGRSGKATGDSSRNGVLTRGVTT
jgi:hypothetical protein